MSCLGPVLERSLIILAKSECAYLSAVDAESKVEVVPAKNVAEKVVMMKKALKKAVPMMVSVVSIWILRA